MNKSVLEEIISILLIALFAYAAISKLIAYNTFEIQLLRSPYLTRFAGFIAWSLPVSELLTVLLLLVRRGRLLGLYASFFLMLVFTGYVYAMLHFSYFLPCSCGGVLSIMTWRQHFIFNTIFTALALSGILLQQKPLKYKEG